MGRHTRMVWVALACIVAIIAVYACGGKGARTIPQIFTANNASQNAASPVATKPEDILMKRLTAAFESALAARGGKAVAAAPSGEDNLIVDLNYTLNGLEGNHLTWHYRNLGDYNQDGVVNIADLTPLAMHFGETIAENPLVEVIDGDMDGIVGIGDAGVIGTYFQNTVSAYVVESSAAEDGEYAEVGRVEFAGATGGTNGWKDFAFALTATDALWYRVVPVDAQDARGTPSMPVQFQSPSLAPRIISISPSRVEPDTLTEMVAVVQGEEPFTYEWHFAATDMPAYSTDASPKVYFKELGRRVCRLKVSNAHGQHTYYFAVLVAPTEYSPFIFKLWPTTATANTMTQFFAQASGTEPLSWHWNFGGGAIPYESNEAWPKVKLGQPGTYNASLTVTNALGQDTYYFSLTITPAAMPPVIERVWPTAVTAYKQTQLYAQVSGTEPLTWHWDFGGGATPNQADEAWPKVVIGAEGTYDCSLTVSNSAGQDTFYFMLTAASGIADWPMYQHDRQRTGRSLYIGPHTPTVKWRFRVRDGYSSPVIAADGTVYVYDNNNLYAFNSDGTIKWNLTTTGYTCSNPAIGTDGTIYIQQSDGYLYAINPDSTLAWRYRIGSPSTRQNPAIGADGTIYATSNGYMYAFSSEGELLWSNQQGAFDLAIGADGTIYSGGLYAYNPDGSLKWKYSSIGHEVRCPAVGIDGTIYAGCYSDNLYAFNQDGSLKWRDNMSVSCESGTSIGEDSTVYVGCTDGGLYAFDTGGISKWKFQTGGPVRSTPAIGADGTIYFGSDDGFFYAVNPDGTLLWSYETGIEVPNGFTSSPAIGSDGTVYVVGGDNCIYAFKDNSPPAILSVSSAMRMSGYELTLSAELEGVEPFTYAWDFGGGATPNLSNEASPTVTVGEPGVYNASLTVINAFGEDVYNFTLTSIGFVPPGDWSMFGREPTHSRRSPYMSAQSPAVKWDIDVGGWLHSSPAISADGTVYLAAVYNSFGDSYPSLFAINPDGTIKWCYETAESSYSSPAIGADGTIYIGSYDEYLYANNPDGTLKWRYLTGGDVRSSPAISQDGTIYVGSDDDCIYAINPDGTMKWRYLTGGNVGSSPAIAEDGTIFIGSDDDYLYALYPDGALKWRYPTGGRVSSSPAVGSDGTVFVGSTDQYLYAFYPDGTLIWRYQTGSWIYSSPAIGADGEVYIGSSDHYLHAVNPDGTLMWRYLTGKEILSSPAIGADGTIYVNSDDGYAINRDGTLKWRYANCEGRNSPAIGDDGTLYMGNTAGNLYAFHGQGPATVAQVTPTNAASWSDATFKAEVGGEEPFSYTWDFGGGAVPNISNEYSPTVTIGAAGDYDASLTVNNSYGEFVYHFTLTSFDTALPGDWSMFGRERTHNRRSPFVGPQTATLKWRYQTGAEIDSGPVICADGTVYVVSYDNYIYAVNSNGTLKWRYLQSSSIARSSPAIGTDGTIFAVNSHGLEAINSNGTLKWFRDLEDIDYIYSTSPVIGDDGTVYLISSYGRIYAINPSGTWKWYYSTGYNYQYSSPAIGLDGTVYAGISNALYAFDSSGQKKWDYEASYNVYYNSPTISSDGTSYVGDWVGYLYAINSDGFLKWRYLIGDGITSSPAIGADGVIYVGSFDTHMYAINPDGMLRWRFDTGNYVVSSPAIGANGTIYVGSEDKYLYAINPDGTLKWRYLTGGNIESSPAIAEDGTVYIGSNDGYLYAFHD